MNERKFLKQINEKNNEYGEFTIATVENLMFEQLEAEQQKELVTRKTGFFSKLFNKNKKYKSGYQIIEDNFELILSKVPKTQINTFLYTILQYDKLNDVIKNKFPELLKKINKDDGELGSFLFDFVRDNSENHEFIQDNTDLILENTKINQLFRTVGFLNKETNANKEKLNNKLEENKLQISGELLIASIWRRFYGDKFYSENDRKEESELIKEQYAPTVMIMIEELLKEQNKKWIDIKEVGTGAYSNVYEIGDKILKIGNPRKKFEVPNHKRILQPLTRINLQEDKDDKLACIEICEKVGTDYREDFNEVIYEIYRDLRDDGIIWTDTRWKNVGKLLKDNVVTLNGEKINVAPNSIGFDKSNKDKYLKAGEFVILDTDYIFKEGDPELENINKTEMEPFEKRYLQEKTNNILKKENQKQMEVIKDYER
ncbi:MAG: hypothetical protein IJ890_07750 [Clostridia bacterium]|nr:hypothetical protein [Clostridia bacterium]